MSTRLWFYLDTARALAEHAAAGSAFDLTDPDAVDQPALMMIADDGVCLRSNALPPPETSAAVYAQGAPATSDPDQRVIPGVCASDDLVFFLPLDPGEADGLLSGLRQASAVGDRWLVIATADDAEHLTAYTRASLEAGVHSNARWVDAQVRIYGVLGPYPAQVADGYRWSGWCRPRFTTATVESIAADLATLTGANPPETRVRLRRQRHTVEVVVGNGTGRQQTQLVPADAAGMFAIDGPLWCWETFQHDDPGHVVGRPTAAPPRCLCPRRCLLCGRPGEGAHTADCAWCSGSPAGHRPHLAAQPVVLDTHTHRPGCAHVVPNPAALLQQLTTAGDLACMVCAAVNTYEHVPHFGAQPGHRTRCTTCGTYRDTVDGNSLQDRLGRLAMRPQ